VTDHNDHEANLEAVMRTELERRRDTWRTMAAKRDAALQASKLAHAAYMAGNEAVTVARQQVTAMCDALAALGYSVPPMEAAEPETDEDGAPWPGT